MPEVERSMTIRWQHRRKRWSYTPSLANRGNLLGCIPQSASRENTKHTHSKRVCACARAQQERDAVPQAGGLERSKLPQAGTCRGTRAVLHSLVCPAFTGRKVETCCGMTQRYATQEETLCNIRLSGKAKKLIQANLAGVSVKF